MRTATGPRDVATLDALALDAGERVLIEASAGTGKTWTIAALYLRLVLGHGRRPTGIVVTTFTDAAASELSERIRSRLGAALTAAEADDATRASDDADWLATRWSDESRRAADRLALMTALADLPAAPIGTLHSLARRILIDFAIEPGAFDLIDDAEFLAEAVDDALRLLAADPAPGARWWRRDRRRLENALRTLLGGSRAVDHTAPDAIADWLSEEHRAALRDLAASPGLFLPKKKAVANALERLAAFLDAGDLSATLSGGKALAALDLDDQVSPARIAELAGATLFRDALRIDRWLRMEPERRDAGRVLAALVERVRGWRTQRLAERGAHSFDSLIATAHAALTASDRSLADRVHQRWPVVLVDECQDTDARQFAMIDAIGRDVDGTPRGLTVLIGDPKQAIYRFRGGDLDAYLAAIASATQRLTLATNYRSSRACVAAVNRFYALTAPGFHSSMPGRPLAPPPIDHHPVAASGKPDATPLTIAGAVPTAALTLHYLADPPTATGPRRERALAASAAQIAALLGGGQARIGDRPLAAGDLAVLLPRNADVARLRELLADVGVAAVGSGRDSVFETDAAADLAIVLAALVDADGDLPSLAAALATPLLGRNRADLITLRTDPATQAHAWTQRQAWRAAWLARGVLALVLALIDSAVAAGVALDERTLTDLVHLGELLATPEAGGTPAAQLSWLRRQLAEPHDPRAGRERQLRLPSDAGRVRLMTLHAAKGLEFGIVFLPLMWMHAWQERNTTAEYTAADGRRGYDVGSLDYADHLEHTRVEDQDERFRTLYVALTRAIHACHVQVLPPSRPRDGRANARPPADPERSALDVLIERLLPRRAEIEPVRDGLLWCDDVGQVESPAPLAAADIDTSSWSVRPLPPPRRLRRSASFSSLVGPHAAAVDHAVGAEDEFVAARDDDDGRDAGSNDSAHAEILALADHRGPEFGNALHQVFEERAPGPARDADAALIDEALQRHLPALIAAERQRLAAQLGQRIGACLDADLGGGLTLAGLPSADQVVEPGFHFAAEGIDVGALLALLVGRGLLDPDTHATPRAPLDGLVSGRIDLVLRHDGRYHLLDYKSNWLGTRVDDYRGDALAAAMRAQNYPLQALLYMVALERWLRERLAGYERERHLGDAIYLFVRAAGLAPGAGVWRQHFDDALLDAAQAILSGGAPEMPA